MILLAWEHIEIPQDKLESITRKKGVCIFLLRPDEIWVEYHEWIQTYAAVELMYELFVFDHWALFGIILKTKKAFSGNYSMFYNSETCKGNSNNQGYFTKCWKAEVVMMAWLSLSLSCLATVTHQTNITTTLLYEEELSV